MSVVATFPNGTIDWERVIQRYAEENEMSYRDTAYWLSKRDSLEAGVQLLGVVIDGAVIPPEMLNSFGEWLDRHGYNVPTMRVTTDSYVKAWGRGNRVTGQVSVPEKEESEVTVDITRDEYLDMRRQGMNRAQVARRLGVKQASLYPHLERWGLKDMAVELAEMDAGPIYPLNPPEPSMRLTEALEATRPGGEKPIIPQAPVPYVPDTKEGQPRISMEVHAEREAPKPVYYCVCGAEVDEAGVACSTECADNVRAQMREAFDQAEASHAEPPRITQEAYVTIRIPVPQVDVEIPTELRTMDRQSTVAEVMEKLAACVQWVAMDARELTGQQDVTAMVQAYVERVMAG